MMVGHSMLAFALVAGGATLWGWSRERALVAGGAAAAFALVPDADMVYALSGVVGVEYRGVFVLTSSFWGASTAVHRSATHSLVMAVPAAGAFALWTLEDRRARAGAVAVLSALVGGSYVATGPLDAAVVAVFGAAGLGVATAVDRASSLDAPAIAAVALVALLSHPFGDLFTGTVPALLYPLDVPALDGIVVLHPDPTLHLLGAFGLELATVWLAAAVYLSLTDTALVDAVAGRAALGVAYAPAALVLQPPTLDASYHFVFSIIGIGAILAAPSPSARRLGSVLDPWRDPGVPGGAETDGGTDRPLPVPFPPIGSPPPERVVSAAMTGTAAVTVAWLAYLAVYLHLLA